jgi:hypothetical protein
MPVRPTLRCLREDLGLPARTWITMAGRHIVAYDLQVAFWDPVQSHHVRQAVAEYDQLGQDEFLTRHGFGRAYAYLLILGGKGYDSKAILGVAYQLATGRPLGPHDFSGGVQGAAGVLRAMGFEILNIRDCGQDGQERGVRLPAPLPAQAACQVLRLLSQVRNQLVAGDVNQRGRCRNGRLTVRTLSP